MPSNKNGVKHGDIINWGYFKMTLNTLLLVKVNLNKFIKNEIIAGRK